MPPRDVLATGPVIAGDGMDQPEREAPPSGFTVSFDILDLRVEIVTPSVEARAALWAVFRGFHRADGTTSELRQYDLHPEPAGAWRLRSRDEETIFEASSLPAAMGHLEWQVINAALATREAFCQLHGAALALPLQRSGLLLVGGTGRGKTTLALGLMMRGFSAYSDDVILLDPVALQLHPLRRAFHVSHGTWAALEPLAGPPSTDVEEVPGFFSPPQWANEPVPVRWILFPEYRANQTPELIPLSPTEAATGILGETLSLEHNPRVALAAVARLTEQARCFRFLSGELAASVAAVQRLVTTDGKSAQPRG